MYSTSFYSDSFDIIYFRNTAGFIIYDYTGGNSYFTDWSTLLNNLLLILVSLTIFLMVMGCKWVLQASRTSAAAMILCGLFLHLNGSWAEIFDKSWMDVWRIDGSVMFRDSVIDLIWTVIDWVNLKVSCLCSMVCCKVFLSSCYFLK